jgi:hypothetical protein
MQRATGRLKAKRQLPTCKVRAWASDSGIPKDLVQDTWYRKAAIGIGYVALDLALTRERFVARHPGVRNNQSWVLLDDRKA